MWLLSNVHSAQAVRSEECDPVNRLGTVLAIVATFVVIGVPTILTVTWRIQQANETTMLVAMKQKGEIAYQMTDGTYPPDGPIVLKDAQGNPTIWRHFLDSQPRCLAGTPPVFKGTSNGAEVSCPSQTITAAGEIRRDDAAPSPVPT